MENRFKKSLFKLQLPPSLESQYRETQIKSVDKLVRSGTVLMSAAIWLGLFLATAVARVPVDGVHRLALFFQLIIFLGFLTTFLRGPLRYSIIWLTPLFFSLISYVYVTEIIQKMEPQFQAGTHGLMIFMVLVAYVAERLFLSLAVCSGLLISGVYLSQTVGVGLQIITLPQQLFHLLLANGLGIFTCYLLTRHSRARFLAETVAENDRNQMESLLNRILPASIAKRMNAGESKIAEHYADVTVAFIDIVGFTEFTSNTDAKTVVDVLGDIFSIFDRRSDQFGIEKIKTIGDGYMVVCGCPTPNPQHAKAVVNFAMACMRDLRQQTKQFEHKLSMRVGLSTGSVIGGVLESRRMGFDIWGDTVNTASRMESSALKGEILMSEESYEVLKHEFRFGAQRTANLKGKGQMTVYPLARRQAHIKAA